MNDRLEVFLPSQRRRYAELVPAIDPSAWPALDGCLAVLCASRSGSTVLCREIERRYRFRRINESLRLPPLSRLAADGHLGSVGEAITEAVRTESEAGWFAFKAGAEALLVGESSGFVAANLDRLRLILLIRRDLVAQAVSLTKAEQTGIWHSNQVGRRVAGEAAYSAALISQALRRVVAALETLRRYAQVSGVPAARLFYEDFADGNPAAIEHVCDGLALPRRRATRRAPAWRAVEKTGDAINREWAARFRAEMDGETAGLVAAYAAFCAASPHGWNCSVVPTPESGPERAP